MNWQDIKKAREYEKSQNWYEYPTPKDIDILLAEIERLNEVEQSVLNYLNADADTVEECYYKLCDICGIKPQD